ncbi:MAG: type IX secretion system membrane protein PorP/SprF, partial [Bacteroidota bacterium]|nr:type IX secretion system membrane protein PorP/SprF [Bacteroidota bacterium]
MIFKRYIRFKEFFILIFFLLSGLNSNWAQDIHFSQFMSAPLMTNPANTGNFNGNYRLVNNFRSQWVSFADPGYNTVSLSFDQQLFSAKKNLSIG